MGKMRISLPITDATYTYQTKDTGGSFTAAQTMVRGINEQTKNFVSDACDEVLISGAFTNAQVVDRVHLCGLSNLTGLSFSTTIGAASETFSQTAYAEPKGTHRQTMRPTATTSTTASLLITGVGQSKLNITQMVFATSGFLPSHNYDFGADESFADQYDEIESLGMIHAKLRDSKAQESITLHDFSDDELFSLRYMMDEKLVDRMCLFERDIEDDHWRSSYLAVISAGRKSNPYHLGFSVPINLREKYSQ